MHAVPAVIVSRGIRKTEPRKKCRKGKHVLTTENTLVTKDGVRRCRACRENSTKKYLRKHYGLHPTDTGKCENGLHPWTPDNWVVDTSGNTRCRQCRLRAQREHYHKTKVLVGRRAHLGVRRLPCIVAKCKKNSKSNHINYICPFHRVNPPQWVSRHYKIVGTQIIRL